jgi:hypothetical protein
VQIFTTINGLPAQPKPLLFVDVDGVISLFGFSPDGPPAGSFHAVDGIVHFISATAAEHLRELREHFELTWCSGWEEKANEYLPNLLGCQPLPYLVFDEELAATPDRQPTHWKLAAIERCAGARPLAWVDDTLDAACEHWASARPSPTLLVPTEPAVGLTASDVGELIDWARRLRAD